MVYTDLKYRSPADGVYKDVNQLLDAMKDSFIRIGIQIGIDITEPI